MSNLQTETFEKLIFNCSEDGMKQADGLKKLEGETFSSSAFRI